MFLCHIEAWSNPRTPLQAASMLRSICHSPDVLSVMSFQMSHASVSQEKQALSSFKINTQEACLLKLHTYVPSFFHCTSSSMFLWCIFVLPHHNGDVRVKHFTHKVTLFLSLDSTSFRLCLTLWWLTLSAC